MRRQLRERPLLRVIGAAVCSTGAAIIAADPAQWTLWDLAIPALLFLACWLLVDEVVIRLADALARRDELTGHHRLPHGDVPDGPTSG